MIDQYSVPLSIDNIITIAIIHETFRLFVRS